MIWGLPLWMALTRVKNMVWIISMQSCYQDNCSVGRPAHNHTNRGDNCSVGRPAHNHTNRGDNCSVPGITGIIVFYCSLEPSPVSCCGQTRSLRSMAEGNIRNTVDEDMTLMRKCGWKQLWALEGKAECANAFENRQREIISPSCTLHDLKYPYS